MTADEMKKMPLEKLELFLGSTDIVSGFMTPDIKSKEKYRTRLIKDIKDFKCEGIDNIKVKKNNGGNCRRIIKRSFINFILRRKEYISKISIANIKKPSFMEQLRVAIHEVQHGDTNRYIKQDNNGTTYVGLKKTKFINNKWEIIGTPLDEAMNEMYTLLSFENRFPKMIENNTSIENLLYGYNRPRFIVGSASNRGTSSIRTWSFLKLLLVACDNAPKMNYKDLSDYESFIDKTVTLNGISLAKNDLLRAGKYGEQAIKFNEQFDSFCGEKAWDTFLTVTDSMFKCIKEEHRAKALDLTYVINTIDKYKNAKIEYMFNRGLWGITDVAEYEARYDTLRSQIVRDWNITTTEHKKSK